LKVTLAVATAVSNPCQTRKVDRIQTELADACGLSFINSTFFPIYLITNSHWSREDPEQDWCTSGKGRASCLDLTVSLLVTW